MHDFNSYITELLVQTIEGFRPLFPLDLNLAVIGIPYGHNEGETVGIDLFASKFFFQAFGVASESFLKITEKVILIKRITLFK